MSESMKRRPIRFDGKGVKKFSLNAREIGGSVERSFVLPEDKANGLMSVIDEFEVPVTGRDEIERLFAELNGGAVRPERCSGRPACGRA